MEQSPHLELANWSAHVLKNLLELLNFEVAGLLSLLLQLHLVRKLNRILPDKDSNDF